MINYLILPKPQLPSLPHTETTNSLPDFKYLPLEMTSPSKALKDLAPTDPILWAQLKIGCGGSSYKTKSGRSHNLKLHLDTLEPDALESPHSFSASPGPQTGQRVAPIPPPTLPLTALLAADRHLEPQAFTRTLRGWHSWWEIGKKKLAWGATPLCTPNSFRPSQLLFSPAPGGFPLLWGRSQAPATSMPLISPP